MADLNQIEFSWENMEVVVMGRPLVRILDIKIKPNRAKKALKGRGSNTLGFGRGNYDYSGSLKIGQSELIALERALGNLLDTSFDINVAYRQGTDLVRKRYSGIEVENWEEGMAQGDPDMEITLTFQCRSMETI